MTNADPAAPAAAPATATPAAGPAAGTQVTAPARTRRSLIWGGLVLGMGPTLDGGRAPVNLGAEHAALVLGPPRSGKTSSIVVPSILEAPAAVVSTSTKGDVLQATYPWRSRFGVCYVFDPTGSVALPRGAVELRWSPISGCEDFEAANAMAYALANAAAPAGERGEGAHWVERAEALLAPLLHAAATAGCDMADVCRWVLGHDVREPEAILAASGALMAKVLLSSIWRTEERERSGIFSTAARLLSAYRSDRALQAACRPNFDPHGFAAGTDTLYICAPAHAQEQLTPLVVALLEQIRAALYMRRARYADSAPMVFALDEVANIAPLPSLPQLAAEGAGQGLVTLACLQDLSQARARWGAQAEGFFSIFSVKIVLPGIGDPRTLDLLSALGGDVQVPVESVSRPPAYALLLGKGQPTSSTTTSYVWRRRLPVDQIAQGRPGSALCVMPGRPLESVMVVPWWEVPRWRSRVLGES